MRIKSCRFCQGKLSLIISFGKMPIANYFPSEKEIPKEKRFPLDFCVCRKCGLAQLGFIIPNEEIFKSYHYMTGASEPLVDHLNKLANLCIEEFSLRSSSKVLDIGANDGTFLLQFKRNGIETLGVDPASNMVEIMKERGLSVVEDFFDKESAQKILKNHGKFDLISATRVLANVVDINSFVRNVSSLLAPKGVFVVEVSSLSEMLIKHQFDSIYHEHYSYFSFETLSKILEKHNLRIFKLEKSVFQGGELRIFATHTKNVGEKLFLKENISREDFSAFTRKIRKFRREFKSFVDGRKYSVIAGFGAPAKAVTLLNYCGTGKDRISFIVDSTPLKQGRFLPGMHIPVFPENYLKKKKIDCCILFAWNYRELALVKIKRLVLKSTKIIIPFTNLDIVEL